MKLFTEYPCLEGDKVLLRKIRETDAEALRIMTEDAAVYRYLPTFLFEQKYDDTRKVIERMDEECFLTRESILLAVCMRNEPDHLIGIAEIYNYEENKAKASIGCRLSSEVWGRGIATEVIGLLKDYLLGDTDVKTITAHIMVENKASAAAVKKNGFLNKYPDLYGDWGFPELCHTDKYVYKKEWLENSDGAGSLPAVHVEQFVMAYLADQDRIRAMLPEGFQSLRPVLRINTEIRNGEVLYVELNTPVGCGARKGWLNIANWKSKHMPQLRFEREGKSVRITAPFLELTYTGTGIEGGCPAEHDNDGCFYVGNDIEFRPAETIGSNKEFCDCSFAWKFHEGDARGRSEGKTIPAQYQPPETAYPSCSLSAENAASIPCQQVLGAYVVRFCR